MLFVRLLDSQEMMTMICLCRNDWNNLPAYTRVGPPRARVRLAVHRPGRGPVPAHEERGEGWAIDHGPFFISSIVLLI